MITHYSLRLVKLIFGYGSLCCFFPEVQGYQRGDQLIHVNVWTPQNLTSEEKNMLEKLNDSPNFKPQPGKSEKSFFDKLKEAFS